MKKTTTRRNFLLQAGGTGLLLPFLPSLLPKALAADGKPPKRFIAISHRYGHHVPHFWPNPPPMTKLNDNTFYGRLSDIPGPMSRVLSERFDPFRSKMNLYCGLDSIGGGGHNSTVPLQGGGYIGAEGEDSAPKYGKSIDVLMMNSPNVYAGPSRFQAIRIGNGNTGVSWDRDVNGVAKALNYMAGNQTVFNTIFGGATDLASQQASNQKQKLIVDKIYERYQALRNNPRLSSVDKNRFEHHVATVADVQTRLLAQNACSLPPVPNTNDTTPAELVWRNNIDMMVSAMACDMTRIGIMHISDFQFGASQNYSVAHGISHDRESNPDARALSDSFSDFKVDQVVYLLDKLSKVIEADGSTMLDNTVVLWTTELTNGNFHVSSCLPVVTFGSAGGAIKTGYFMDFRLKPIQYLAGRSDFYAPLGQPYNRLLITLMRAMGLQPSEYLSHGDGGGFGELKEEIQYLTNQYTQFKSLRNDPLPIVY